jgi:hypothetical protein
MQRKDVSSESTDPDLGNGLAFFGEVNAYMAHLEKYWDQPQPVRTSLQNTGSIAHAPIRKVPVLLMTL